MSRLSDRTVDPGRIVLRVWCQACTTERRENPGLLGVIERRADGLCWVATLPRAVIGGGWEYLSHASGPPARVRETLRAACKHHGRGRVSSHGILGQTGSVVANLIR